MIMMMMIRMRMTMMMMMMMMRMLMDGDDGDAGVYFLFFVVGQKILRNPNKFTCGKTALTGLTQKSTTISDAS